MDNTLTKRILLCDDEFHIVRAAEIKFQRRGFEVRTASDGEEAWAILLAWKPDVLVTDCQMPRLDGLGLVQRVRDCEELADLPVLMLTAKSFERQYRESAEDLDILGVIPKPFSPRELLQRVEQIVELRHAAPVAGASEPGAVEGSADDASRSHEIPVESVPGEAAPAETIAAETPAAEASSCS